MATGEPSSRACPPIGTWSFRGPSPPPWSWSWGTRCSRRWRRGSPMSPEGLIHTEHLWKRFRSDRRRMLFRDEIQRLGARLRGKEGVGWRWALRDVNLHAEPGESIGLVGVNGSGKTTLLKTLAQVMYPYAGRVAVGGRVGALIEVRAGIHPDL